MQSRRIIQVAVKGGRLLNAFEGDSITVEIQKKGEYDGNTLASLREILARIQPQTSLDIGANIGNHALVIAQYSGTLIAFEPVWFIYDVLQSNVGLNELRNVVALNIGLSNEDSNRDIFIPENGNLGSSSLEATSGIGDFLQIKTVIGDDYLQACYAGSRIDFIKIDVEGHEAPALMGLCRTIARDQPLLLIVWNSPKTISAFKASDLFATLFSGYGFYSLSSTDNKKVHPRRAMGFLRRLAFRILPRKWCLSSFEPEKHYSDVYLVPKRYQSAFSAFRYFER
jgi:FkbM family methyltransferase